MLQIQDLNVMKGCPETRRLQPGTVYARTDDNSTSVGATETYTGVLSEMFYHLSDF